MTLLFPPPEATLPAQRSPWLRYGAALAFVTLALSLAYGVTTSVAGTPPYAVVLLVAVGVAGWYGGWGPSIAATVAGMVAARFLFMRPVAPWYAVPSADLVELAMLAAGGVALTALGVSYRRTFAAANLESMRARQQADEAAFEASHLRLAAEQAEQYFHRAAAARDQLRAELESLQERLGRAEASGQFTLFEWDHASGTMAFSDRASYVFGATIGGTTNYDSFLQIVLDADRQRCQESIGDLLSAHRPLDLEFRLRCAGRDPRCAWLRAGTTYDAAGHPLRTIGVLHDVTQRTLEQQAQLRNEKLLAAGRLAHSIAHELNNPLSAATNLLYIIKDDRSLSRAGKQYAAMAEEELRRLTNTAKQALGFYRENAQPGPLLMNELVEEVVSDFSRNVPASVTLEVEQGPVMPLEAVRGELRQAFSNLVANALQAVGESGKVKISVEAARPPLRRGVRVMVQDDGSGIPGENLAAVFEPFFTTRPEAGSGLGLWLAKEIIEKHGGSIEVHSSVAEEDHGTTFVVFLPAPVQERVERASLAS
jgi:signal transduction histidine kinase